ncbi:MAG: hypothetical protein LAT68_10190 [Cyclobacteriaceae bacterium]|nr:hypothetical protein [Cyclobacteriaceae bacterium]MCH8516683.1 hypothetical protein [Cyclobacteriaceae bacterium]
METEALIEISLFVGYAAIIIATAGVIILPLINSIDDPKSLIGIAIGILVLGGIYGIAYLLSGAEVTSVYLEHNIDTEGASKSVGGAIITMYLMLGLAIAGIIFTEIRKALN